jgi:hypothetical protein
LGWWLLADGQERPHAQLSRALVTVRLEPEAIWLLTQKLGGCVVQFAEFVNRPERLEPDPGEGVRHGD